MSDAARPFFASLLPAIVRRHPNLASYLGCCLQVTLEEPGGVTDDWCLDFRDPERWTIENRRDALPDATLRMTSARFESLLSEPIPAWANAYATGEIRVDGDLVAVAGLKGLFDHMEPSRLKRWALRILGPERAIAIAARRVS
jgi:hypothetical protein